MYYALLRVLTDIVLEAIRQLKIMSLKDFFESLVLCCITVTIVTFRRKYVNLT